MIFFNNTLKKAQSKNLVNGFKNSIKNNAVIAK